MTDEPDDVPSGLTGRPVRSIPEPQPLAEHGPAVVIAMCNQKGGVGKTTSTINLGAALAECGRRVLLVDLDPQGALSAGLGVPHYELAQTVHNLLVEPRVGIDEVLIHTRVPDLDLVPSNIDLSAAEVQLLSRAGVPVLTDAPRGDMDRLSQLLRAGAADVVVTPCDPDEVARKLARAIRKSERKK